MRCTFAFLSALFAAGFLPAQPSPLSGPVEGFTYDAPTRSFRGVIGSLGSASLGTALLPGIEYGSVAPHQDFGIAFRDGQCLIVSGLSSSQISTAPLPVSFPVPEGVAWSGDGSVAILFSRTGNWIQMLAGLPGAANPGSQISLSPLGGSLSAVAADLHGEHVAVGITGETAGIYQIVAGQSFAPLVYLPQPIAIAFSEDGGVLYAVDGAAHQLTELHLADMASQTWPLDGMEDPFSVMAAQDAASRPVVYVAGRSDRLLVAYDAASHEAIATVPLYFQPTMIERLGSGSFLLAPRAANDDPLWSFTNAPQPAVYFVPATPLQLSEDRSR